MVPIGRLGRLVAALKPTDAEILALADQETDPAQCARFEPIARGPVFAVLALAAVGIASIPGIAWRALRSLTGADDRAR
jgi:hypothetical protein